MPDKNPATIQEIKQKVFGNAKKEMRVKLDARNQPQNEPPKEDVNEYWNKEGGEIFLAGKEANEQAETQAEKDTDVPIAETKNSASKAAGEKLGEKSPANEPARESITMEQNADGIFVPVGAETAGESDLEKNLRETRTAYVVANDKFEDSLKGMKKFFGGWLKTESKEIPEVNEAYDKYRSAQNLFKDSKIQELRGKNLSGDELKKEMAALVKYFDFEEKRKLYDQRQELIDAKAEGASGWVTKSKKYLDWYRKLDWKKKVAVSAALGITGAGLGLVGAAGAAGAVAAVQGGVRILGGAASGVGMAELQKNLRRRSDEKAAEKRAADMLAFLDSMHGEEAQFAFLKSTLGESVEQTDEKFRREIRKAFSRKVAGVAVFAFVGSGAMGHLVKAGFSQAMEKFFGEHQVSVPGIKKSIIEGIADRKGSGMPKSEHIITAKADAMEAKMQAATESLAENKPAGASGLAQGLAEQPASGFDKEELIKLAVKKGGSIEKSIIDYLGEHKDLIDKYNSMPELSNGHKLNAGQIAHRMALEYAKNKNIDFDKLNHIQPGDVHLSHDAMHLEGTPGRPPVLDPSQIDLKGIPTDSHGMPKFTIDSPSMEAPSGEPFSMDAPHADMPSHAELPNIESHIPDNLGEAQGIGNLHEHIPNNIPSDVPSVTENISPANNLPGAETMMDSAPSAEAIKQSSEIVRRISNGSWDNWKEMRSMTFTQARRYITENNLGRHRGWNLAKILKEYARMIGEEKAKPSRGETLQHWMSRVAKALAEKNKTISV